VSTVLDVQTISIIIASASVVAGLAYSALQLREQTRTRHADFVMRLCSAYGSEELTKAMINIANLEFGDFDDFLEKYGKVSAENPIYVDMMMVSAYFQGIGFLVYKKSIDIEIVANILPVHMWEKIKPIVYGIRKLTKQPHVYSWFEYLYDEVMKDRKHYQLWSG
jgi:hypothetical protein